MRLSCTHCWQRLLIDLVVHDYQQSGIMKNFSVSYLHHGGDEFDWAVAYDARDIKIILLDALMPIAQHFEDLDKRRDWFLALVNSHLS